MVCLKGEGGLVIHGPLRGEEADLWSGELRMSLDGLAVRESEKEWKEEPDYNSIRH